MQDSGLMGGSDEEWMVKEGPERVEDQGEGEMLYCNNSRSRTNRSVRR